MPSPDQVHQLVLVVEGAALGALLRALANRKGEAHPMANTKTTTGAGKVHRLEKYRSEAKGEPFVLEIDDNRSITIPRPTGDQLIELSESERPRQVLRNLCGDQQFEELMDAVGGDDYSVLTAILEDVRAHFGLGEAGASLT